MLADDRCDAEDLVSRLRTLGEQEQAPVFAGVLHMLAHLSIPDVQAERLLDDLLRHRDEVRRALGRDPGLRVATIDYLTNVKKLLANPTVVESSQLERTERSAVTDPLTRLYNRRFFARALALEIRRSHRYALRLSLLMLDLDGFKRLNDEHGHMFGDLVLHRVGRVLRRAVRDADTPCRFGGEEFAVILPETDRLGAYTLAERVRRALRDEFCKRRVNGTLIEVTVSGGIASYPVDGEEPSELIARADAALYVAKRGGKDRISPYHSEQRETIRYPAREALQAELRAMPDGPLLGVTPLNLSRGGGLLDLEGEVPDGEPVEIIFHGRDRWGRPRIWNAAARVVRVERAAGPDSCGRIAVAFDGGLQNDCLDQQVQRSRPLRVVGGAAG